MINKYIKYKVYKGKGLSGLKNLGNTCYMNSVLQCLSNVLNLTHYLRTCKTLSEDEVLNSYVKLLNGIWEANSPIIPKSFKKNINKKLKKYNTSLQHDSNEFLLDFLDLLNSNLINKKVKISSNNIYSNKYIKQANNTWNEYFNNTSTVISELFYGQYIKSYKCRGCNENMYKTFEPFITLNLHCNRGCDVNDLIREHFNRDYIYTNCKECSGEYIDKEYELNTEILKCPEILILTINRFNNDLTKNNKNIKINNTIDLCDYISISGESSIDKSTVYELNSIICHTGDLNDGHYNAIIKNDKEWYCFDDCNVNKYDITKLDDSTPYILFYEIIKTI